MKTNYSSVTDTRGRITVPRAIRRRLGLSAGDRLPFVVESGRVVLRPTRLMTKVLDKYIAALGTVPGGKTQIIVWLRKLRDE